MEAKLALGEIATAFAEIDGVEAVSLGGSAVTRRADELSDFDLYAYFRTEVPVEARREIIARRTSDYRLDNRFWDQEDEWIEPDGKRFDVMYRPCEWMEGEIGYRLQQCGASLGYTTAICFSVAHGESLADPNGWFEQLQTRTRQPYPDELVRAIWRKNRPPLKGGMQSCYFVQLEAALARDDPVSGNHRVAAWLASYFDILFALNRRYHPGEKRLLAYAADLPSLPENALFDVENTCALAGTLDLALLEHLAMMVQRLDSWAEGQVSGFELPEFGVQGGGSNRE
jgi:predicted nucleotidyltransferase